MNAKARLHLSRLSKNCGTECERLNALGIKWIPEIRCGMPETAIKRMVDCGVTRIACRDTITAIHAAKAGVHDVLLIQSGICTDDILAVIDANRGGELSLFVDHFVHLEQAARIAVDSGVEIALTIGVRTCPDLPGVRPGRDVLLLFEAAEGIPGLRVSGICAITPEEFGGTASENQSIQRLGDTLSACATTHSLLERREKRITDVILQTELCPGSALDYGAVSAIVNDAALFPTGAKAAGEILPPAITVTAPVISRPGLETAVLGTGTDLLGCATNHPRILSISGATPTRIQSTTMTLRLEGAACDLIIGDTVELGVPPTTGVLRRVQVTED